MILSHRKQRGFLSPALIGIWSGGSSSQDPYFSSVTALLHCDGADASTTFTDVTGKTWTANGNAQIDTAQSKFGGASGQVDGSGDYITTTTHAGFGFEAGDYTVECFVRVGSTGDRTLFDNRSGANAGIGIYVSITASARKLVLANNSVEIATSTNQIPTNTWAHIAVARSGTTVKGFIDGVEEFSVTDSRTLASSAVPFFGSNYVPGQYMLGHFDEARITKGVARYTAAFTAPTAPFPDS